MTLLVLFGFLIGLSGLDLLPEMGDLWFRTVANIALVMVGFLLWGKLTLVSLREYGRFVLWISTAIVVATAAIVTAALLFAGAPFEIALLFAGIAPATAPAATTDVVHQTRSDGPFTRTLLGIVAIDDAWASSSSACLSRRRRH